MHPPSPRLETFFHRFGIVLALLSFAWGAFTFDVHSLTFAAIGLAYGLPLAFAARGWGNAQVYATWLALILCLQTVVPLALPNHYFHLVPNLQRQLEIKAGVLTGLGGRHWIRTDAHGYRHVGAVDYKSDRSLRLFAIGGSTTEDIHLDDEKTWTHLLETSLRQRLEPSLEIINTGLSGLRAENNLATLKYVRQFHPKLAIFLLGVNDWNDHIREHFRPALSWRQRLVDWRHRTMLHLSPLGQLLRPPRELLVSNVGKEPAYEDGGYYTRQWNSLERAVKHEWKPSTVTDRYRRDLQAISRTCREAGISCLFVTQPSAYREDTPVAFRKYFWMTPPNEDYALTFDSMVHIARLYNDTLITFAREQGHPYCDIASKLPTGEALFFDDVHFHDEGAKKVATALVDCVENAIRSDAKLSAGLARK